MEAAMRHIQYHSANIGKNPLVEMERKMNKRVLVDMR
jgi:hypothetical protein